MTRYRCFEIKRGERGMRSRRFKMWHISYENVKYMRYNIPDDLYLIEDMGWTAEYT